MVSFDPFRGIHKKQCTTAVHCIDHLQGRLFRSFGDLHSDEVVLHPEAPQLLIMGKTLHPTQDVSRTYWGGKISLYVVWQG